MRSKLFLYIRFYICFHHIILINHVIEVHSIIRSTHQFIHPVLFQKYSICCPFTRSVGFAYWILLICAEFENFELFFCTVEFVWMNRNAVRLSASDDSALKGGVGDKSMETWIFYYKGICWNHNFFYSFIVINEWKRSMNKI